MARLQELQKELADRQEDLREAEYDRYISDQEGMLDRLYGEYSEAVEKKLDDFMSLVREGLGIANGNTSLIADYLGKVASENGYLEEFKSLFTRSGGIGGGVSGTVKNIELDEKHSSGTEKPKGGLQHTDGENMAGGMEGETVRKLR